MTTDWVFTVTYLTADEQYKKDFGATSMVMLMSANIITAVLMFVWDCRNREDARFHPIVGAALSFVGLRVSVMASLDAYRICNEGVAQVILSC